MSSFSTTTSSQHASGKSRDSHRSRSLSSGRSSGHLRVIDDCCRFRNGDPVLAHPFQVEFDALFHESHDLLQRVCCGNTARQVWNVSAVVASVLTLNHNGILHMFRSSVAFSI